MKNILLYILFTTVILSCNNDETKPQTFLCCSDNPFTSTNVNNLLNKQIRIPDLFTPNQDNNNENFIIPGLDTALNFSIVIYDLKDIIVYEYNQDDMINNNNMIDWFNGRNLNGEELKFGTYRYRIVIEDEQTYLQEGYVCLVRNKSEINGYDFSNCQLPQNDIDDILTE